VNSEREVGRLNDLPSLALCRHGTDRDRVTELAQESPQAVDALYPGPLPLLAGVDAAAGSAVARSTARARA
jgi:hypothetical protein